MFKKAFTMVELIIALAVVAIMAAVTIGIAKTQMDKIDKYSYYIAYATVQDFAANIVSQNQYKAVDVEVAPGKTLTAKMCENNGLILNEQMGACVTKKTAEDLCKSIKKDYNISASECTITAEQMETGVKDGFSVQTPHIVMANGTNIYIASDLEKLTKLNDASNLSDKIAYLVYVDVNGSKKGKGVLYKDVFPFYLTMSGKVIPAYKTGTVAGGNSAEHLSLNILYDDYTAEGKRVLKVAKTNLDFMTGACETGYIKSAKYCGDKTLLDICNDSAKDCRYIINKPMKFFK